jgi:hypothetical protein
MEESSRNPINSEETAPGGYHEETNLNQQMEAGRKRTPRLRKGPRMVQIFERRHN